MTKIFGIQRSRSLLSHILGPSYGCMPTHFCTIWVNRAQIFVLLHSTVFAVKAFSLRLPCYLSLDCVSLVTVVRVAFCLSFSIFAIVTQNLDFRHEMSASLSAAENEEHSGKFFLLWVKLGRSAIARCLVSLSASSVIDSLLDRLPHS